MSKKTREEGGQKGTAKRAYRKGFDHEAIDTLLESQGCKSPTSLRDRQTVFAMGISKKKKEDPSLISLKSRSPEKTEGKAREKLTASLE